MENFLKLIFLVLIDVIVFAVNKQIKATKTIFRKIIDILQLSEIIILSKAKDLSNFNYMLKFKRGLDPEKTKE